MIQLRPPSLQDEFDFIADSDPALDKERDGFEEELQRYRETGQNPPLKDGAEPTVFRLRPISSSKCLAMLNDLLLKEGMVTYYYQAACLGLVGAQNLPGFTVKRSRGLSGFEQVEVECMDQLPLQVIAEIGKAVVDQTNPPPA